MERKIGEVFEYDGQKYKVSADGGCAFCDFMSDTCERSKSVRGECAGRLRKDGKGVVFVMYKPDEITEEQEEPKATVYKSVLEEALEIVNGSRNVDYGDPVISFIKIGKIATLICGEPMTPIMCCAALMAVKIERESYKHKRDNLVDLCGYTEIMNRLIESETKE